MFPLQLMLRKEWLIWWDDEMRENSWEESLFYRQLWAIFAGETCKWGIIAGGINQVLWIYDSMLCRLPSNHACPPLWCDLSCAMDCSSFSMHLLCYQHMLLVAQLLTCHAVTSTSAIQGTYHVEILPTTVFSTWHALVYMRILHLVLHHAYSTWKIEIKDIKGCVQAYSCMYMLNMSEN